MTTLKLLKKAKEELEKAIAAKNTIIGKALDTAEYQYSQMGRVAAFLDIAIQQEGSALEVVEIEEEPFHDTV